MIALSIPLAGGVARAQSKPDGDPPAGPSASRRIGQAGGLGVEEGSAIIRFIRAQATPEIAEGSIPRVPKILGEALHLPLIVSFYHNGPTGFHYAGARITLRVSAEEAGKRLLEFAPKLPQGARALREGRIRIDIVVRRKSLGEKHRYLLMEDVAPGLDGLICTVEGRTVYFSPIALLRQWRKKDVVKSAYIAQELSAPPMKLRAERIRTASFVEEKPGGKALPVFRANVLLPSPTTPDAVLKAALRGGEWLLRTQQEDGSFLPAYLPTAEKADPEYQYNLVDHLRATLTLMQLHELTKDELFADAAGRALRFASHATREERREGFVYLDAPKNETVATAGLLAALCYDASAEETPTASALMRYLGEYLCVMTAPDGRLYAGRAEAREGKPPYVMAGEPYAKGEPYAEALTALCMLERISPTERVRAAADRLAHRTLALTGDAARVGPRTIEALAEYYKLSKTEQYGMGVLVLGGLLAREQILGRKARYPDWVGGFSPPDLPADTYTTAAATCGLATAHDIGHRMGRPVGQFSEPVRLAAPFLMNMQFREENSFYLRHPEVILGGFRAQVDNLSLRLAPTTEAIRALVYSTGVAARTPPAND